MVNITSSNTFLKLTTMVSAQTMNRIETFRSVKTQTED
jgi:hypothetical protein